MMFVDTKFSSHGWLILKHSNSNLFEWKDYLKVLITELAAPTCKRKQHLENFSPFSLHLAIRLNPIFEVAVNIVIRKQKRQGERQQEESYGCSTQQGHLVYLHTTNACFAAWHSVDLSALAYAKELNKNGITFISELRWLFLFACIWPTTAGGKRISCCDVGW